MNEKANKKVVEINQGTLYSNRSITDFDITLCVGNVNERLSLDVFTAICDNYLYKDICSACEDPSVDSLVYSFYRNKIKCSIKLTPKCHAS